MDRSERNCSFRFRCVPKVITVVIMTDPDPIIEQIALPDGADCFSPPRTNELDESDIESGVPVEISAISSINSSRKKVLTSNVSLLSPSSSTRSKATRKRTTPEKYQPDMGPSVKRKILPNVSSSSKEKDRVKLEKDRVKSVDIIDIDAEVEVQKDIPIVKDAVVLKLEQEAMEKIKIAELNPDKIEHVEAAEESERKFMKSLFKITLRNFQNITWPGWLFGYCREIRLTDFAKETYLPKRKYLFLLSILTFLFSLTEFNYIFLFS